MSRRPGWPMSQLAARALVVVGPVVALLATGPAGRAPSVWVVVPVVLVALVAARRPDSLAGAIVSAGVVAWWVAGLDARAGLSAWVLVAAAGLVVGHVAGLLVDYTPRHVSVPAVVARRWTLRGLVLVAAAVPVWAVGRLLVGDSEPAGAWPLSAVLLVAAALGASVALRGDASGGRPLP